MPSFTPVNVESIYAALFAFLKAGLVTFQRDLGHPGVGLVFWVWQCAKKNHGRCEGWP